jgi:hypothetical protein
MPEVSLHPVDEYGAAVIEKDVPGIEVRVSQSVRNPEHLQIQAGSLHPPFDQPEIAYVQPPWRQIAERPKRVRIAGNRLGATLCL